ncbi:S8 family serine peptidase [Deinococcus sp. JMULE3]|uniref:S8 family peptidase n=1 Tax=Deinococcus sp. JMULE3 TaxID=2518341 RepID=UPI0015755B93|nr:S8 family serine peptidase [Deinococcus sp. JMULE3]NTY01775.1 peptidase S8 [Deinococcus sp. JMULE3]
MRPWLPGLLLTTLLSACGGGGSVTPTPTPTPTPKPICTQAVAGALPVAAQGNAAPGWTVGAADWSRPHVPGRVLVSSVPGGPRLSTLGMTGEEVVPGVTVIRTAPGEEVAVAGRLRTQGVVTQPDYLYLPLVTPNDPGVPGNAGVAVGGARFVQSYLTRVNAPQAWTFLQGCGKTPVAARTAVLDSLVATTHPDLQGRLAAGRSYLGGGSSDDGGHGTATTGVIAATTNNGQGLAGLTWSGVVTPMEVIGAAGASTSTVAQAVRDAVSSGAKVINMSLGIAVTGTADPDPALSAALTSAAGSAVLVASAGNTPGDGLYYPASHPDVIAVGAAGSTDALACYSARPLAGQTAAAAHFMLAPGGSGNCPGATNASQMLVLNQTGGYTLQAGTSFAAPLVSGAAALMRAANPALSAPQAKALLLSSARVTGDGLRFLDVNAAVRAATR